MAHQEPAGRAQGLVLCEAHGDGWAVAPLAGDLGFHRSFPSCVGKLYSADRTRFETFPAQRAAPQAGRQKADVPLVAQPRALPAGEQHHGGAPAPGRPGEAAAGPAPAVSLSVGLSVCQERWARQCPALLHGCLQDRGGRVICLHT